MNNKELYREHELTRQGKNICSCGYPKEMYYNPWCPKCDIPKPEEVKIFNLIQVIKHLNAIGKINDNRESYLRGETNIEIHTLGYIAEYSCVSNDTYFNLYFPEYLSDDDLEEFNKYENNLKEIWKFCNTPLDEPIMFHLSW